MADHFLTKSRLDRGQCLRVGDTIALELYPALHAALLRHAGEAAAALFAEPLVSRGNDEAEGSVTWYTEFPGAGTPLSQLDEGARAQVSDRLRAALAPLPALSADPEIGPLIAAALTVTGEDDFWAVQGAPVIVNWGMEPAGGIRDAAAHRARTFGPFLPAAASSPLPGAAAAAVGAGAGIAAAAAAAPASAAQPPEEDPAEGETGPPAAEPAATRRLPVIAWLPLVLLLLLSGGLLAWLLVPGNRLFPVASGTDASATAEAVAMAEALNRDLETRLAALQDNLEGAQCLADGSLVVPDGRTLEGLLPPDPADPADRAGAVAPGIPSPVLPPAPERTRVQPAGAEAPLPLLELLEARTALVVATAGPDMSTGSGFFIGPDLLLTNHHVIAGAAPDGIFVTSAALGRAHAATLVKSSGPMETTGTDFALLRVEGVSQPEFEIYAPQGSLKLRSVVAAGYPGDVIQSDAQFQALLGGDMTSAPDLIVTDGIVNSEQDYRGGARVVVHSADVSQGNSGGPLVDSCGRIVGVNTFVNRGELRSWNFALSSESLLAFLQSAGAEGTVTRAPCVPVVERPAAARPSGAPLVQDGMLTLPPRGSE
ncbi:trypsin-like peptidase domain-containing protein [Poseidonocella sp. HB161398]|uniref:trypsin-like peptidase domain-containing protein n=1 Tax=Poseidonocella sp. HB161398 TaxID=2320855 RepID=UPI001109C44F|nr:trypsin-like peptidase domain-containing protein [Poseidonocella sp. HB161398]